MSNKVLFITSLSSILLLIPTISNAANYECYRAANAGSWVKTRIPKGNWGPQHNTKNWSYSVVSGKDIYRHKKGNRTATVNDDGIVLRK